MIRLTAISLLALGLLVMPGAHKAEAGGQTVLKFALIVPRNPKMAVEEKKYNQRLGELTNNQVQVRVYWGGAAGDEQDVVRKMRSGQIDGSPLGLDVLSQFARECLVLQTPGLFRNYDQVDAVRKELAPQFAEETYRNGFKTTVWGDIGRLRLFSKKSITKLSDLRSARPWLYPVSEMLKEFYKQVGATGIPLGLAEVYSGMQTGMIDTYWSTSALAAALQWHKTSKFISAEGLGFINGAIVIRRPAWDPLSDVAKKAMLSIVEERAHDQQLEIRGEDDTIFQRLLKRGYTAMKPENPGEWWEAGRMLRRRLIGRIYTEKLVNRAEEIALKYADKEQLAYWKK